MERTSPAARAPAEVVKLLLRLAADVQPDRPASLAALEPYRAVCKFWRHCCDELAGDFEDVELKRAVVLPDAHLPAARPLFAARLERSVRGARRLDLRLLCLHNGQPHLEATLLQNEMALGAASHLEVLSLALPCGLATLRCFDRLLAQPLATSLSTASLRWEPPTADWGAGEVLNPCAALNCLRRLSQLEALAIQVPGPCQLALPRLQFPSTLTSLDLEADYPCVGGRPQTLADLEGPVRLERLRLHNVLSSHQVFPPALSTVTYLEIKSDNGVGIDALSGAHMVLTKLAHLDLHMERCPAQLGALRQLTYLRCWGCFLDAVGAAHEPLEALTDLPALRHLALMGGFAPNALCNCTGLTALELGMWRPPRAQGRCLEVPSLARLAELRHLAIVRCGAASMPDWLPALRALTELKLCYLQRSFPEGGPADGVDPEDQVAQLDLSALERLESLTVWGCGLWRLPRGLTALRSMTRADFRHNADNLMVSQSELRWGARHGLLTRLEEEEG